MRALFPKLRSWGGPKPPCSLAPRVYDYLSQAKTLEDLEHRLRQPLRRYPTELIQRVQLRDGRAVNVRPIRRSDAPLQRSFVRALSPGSRLRRFHLAVSDLSDSLLRYLTEIDHFDHIALLGEIVRGDEARQVSDARWVRRRDEPERADFAIAVADDYQHSGLGAQLMDLLECSAAARGIRSLHGAILRSNAPMIDWLARRGWRFSRDPYDASVIEAELALGMPAAARRQAA